MTVFHEETVFPKHLGAYMATAGSLLNDRPSSQSRTRTISASMRTLLWAEWSTEGDVLKLVVFEPLVS